MLLYLLSYHNKIYHRYKLIAQMITVKQCLSLIKYLLARMHYIDRSLYISNIFVTCWIILHIRFSYRFLLMKMEFFNVNNTFNDIMITLYKSLDSGIIPWMPWHVNFRRVCSKHSHIWKQEFLCQTIFIKEKNY